MSITLGQLASRYSAAAQKVDPATEQALAALVQIGMGTMKRSIQGYHAVDTGTLLNSVDFEKVAAHTYMIGPTVLYAAFIALGTSKMAARPFHITAAKKMHKSAGELGLDSGKLGI
jgi:hypothetical protein